MSLDNVMNDMTIQGRAGGPDRAFTRYKYDLGKMVENNEITTGPGRYVLGVPNAYGNAAYITDPTIRMQKWGASHDMSSTKTDVESDLRNLSRPTTRTVCGQYNPNTEPQRQLTAMPEAAFPQTFARLVDPPCTLRGTGWNRWEWLCQDPQENVMIPFEWAVDSRHAIKDGYHPHNVMKHQCGEIRTAVPVPRQPGARDAPNFTDQIPGVSQAPTGSPGSVKIQEPRGAPPTVLTGKAVGANSKYAVPQSEYHEMERAVTGRIAPPPPFTQFIAPH
jgi:hypothetical protein